MFYLDLNVAVVAGVYRINVWIEMFLMGDIRTFLSTVHQELIVPRQTAGPCPRLQCPINGDRGEPCCAHGAVEASHHPKVGARG